MTTMTTNISLKWWLATGTTTPEVVLVSLLPSPVARLVLGPESLWRPVSEFDAAGEWLGLVRPPTPNAELPPPPAEIFVPTTVEAEAPTTVEAEVSVEAKAPTTVEVEVSVEVEAEVSVPAAFATPAAVSADENELAVCPPEIEAMLGKDKDTMVAAQFNVPVATVAEWRKARGITRFRTKPEPTSENATTPDTDATTKVSDMDAAIANLIAARFAEGASDEDMAQEAGVPVVKVTEVRRKLGLQRPRGRKPGPRKTTEGVEAELDAVVAAPAVPVVDAELDALLG